MFLLFREWPSGGPDTPARHSCLLYVCSWWGLSGNTKVLSLVPCLLSSLFHLFFLVLASLPFPAPNCPNLPCRLWPLHYGLLLLASICLHPVITLPSALWEDLCQKFPLCAVCLPSLSRKILHYQRLGKFLLLREGTSVNYIPPQLTQRRSCLLNLVLSVPDFPLVASPWMAIRTETWGSSQLLMGRPQSPCTTWPYLPWGQYIVLIWATNSGESPSEGKRSHSFPVREQTQGLWLGSRQQGSFIPG